jgi:hypothetical protein
MEYLKRLVLFLDFAGSANSIPPGCFEMEFVKGFEEVGLAVQLVIYLN